MGISDAGELMDRELPPTRREMGATTPDAAKRMTMPWVDESPCFGEGIAEVELMFIGAPP